MASAFLNTLATKSLASGRYPALQAVPATPVDITPDTLFEFGLQRMLDGLGPFL